MRWIRAAAAVLATASGLQGAEPTLPASAYLKPALPSQVRALLDKHGDRLQKPGSERVILTGVLTDGAGARQVVVTTEITGKVQIASAGKAVIYDGKTSTESGRSAGEADLDLLESLQADSAEAFFQSYGRTAAVRFLGGRYRTDGGRGRGYAGPWYDIYELIQPVAVKGGGAKQKLYYFDSETGAFVQTRYKVLRGAQTIEVRTIHSNWRRVNGQAVPGRIERLEDGKPVMSLVVNGAEIATAAKDGTFGER